MNKSVLSHMFFSMMIVLYTSISFASAPIVSWTITRHTDVKNYSADSFNAIIKEANNLVKYWDANLQTDDDTTTETECTGANVDVACAINFVLSGTMDIFSDFDLGIIESETEAELVLKVASAPSDPPYYRFKVVKEVNACVGEVPDVKIIGCARTNATGDAASIVIEAGWAPVTPQNAPGSAASTYVHEFLHNVSPTSAIHRSGCLFNIFNESSQFHFSITEDSDWNNYNTNAVTAAECTRMGGRAFTTRAGNIYTALNSTTEFYFITSSVQPPAGTTMTINAGVEVQVKNGHKFSTASQGKISMRPGGTGGPVKIYTNCNTEYCTKTPY